MESRSVLLQGFQRGKRKICVTVVILGVIIGSVLVACSALKVPHDKSLQQVFVVFRHGDRTPTETYRTDPHINYDWPGGWGALTKTGMKQMYTLGKWVRKNFGWITDYQYLPSTTMVNSSYSDRCIMSAQSLLAGLYLPDDDEERFVPNLAWRPIPVHYFPKYLEKILVVTASCPKLKAAMDEAYQNESLRSDKDLRSYYENLSNLTGQPMKTITDIEFLYNTLEIEEMNGLVIPKEIKEYYNSTMREIAARSLSLFTSTTLMRRLRGGPPLKDILGRMNASRHGFDNTKMYLYGTHDINLVNMLRAMGFTEELFKPEIGASLIFELHVIAGGQTHEVRISYMNDTNTETTKPHRLHIPECAEPCLLDDLFHVWDDVIPDDWDAECKL